MDIVDGGRILRNADYELPNGTAQYTVKLEPLSAQI
jgi:hypothetical protein